MMLIYKIWDTEQMFQDEETMILFKAYPLL